MADVYASAKSLFALAHYLGSTHSGAKTTKDEIFAHVDGYDIERPLAAERMLLRDMRFLESQGFEIKGKWKKGSGRRGYQIVNAASWFSRPSHSSPKKQKERERRPANNILNLLEALSAHQWMSTAHLAEFLGVTRSTLARYLVNLRQIGAPLQIRRGFGAYSHVRLRPGVKLPQWTPERMRELQEMNLRDPSEVLRRLLGF